MAMQTRRPLSRSLPAQPNQGLIDGLALLQALATSREAVGVRDLARRLGWNAMRVNRLLKTLAALGLARQTPDRRYTAGPALHVLSIQSLFASRLVQRAMEAVEQLPTKQHSVALGVLWQDRVCYLFHAAPGQAAAAAIGAHDLYPATRSSIGMMLLSALSEAEVRRLYAGREIEGYRDISELLADLEKIRADGFAFVVQKQRPYQASVAVPIGSPPYAALALAHEMTRERARGLIDAMHAAAGRIGRSE